MSPEELKVIQDKIDAGIKLSQYWGIRGIDDAINANKGNVEVRKIATDAIIANLVDLIPDRWNELHDFVETAFKDNSEGGIVDLLQTIESKFLEIMDRMPGNVPNLIHVLIHHNRKNPEALQRVTNIAISNFKQIAERVPHLASYLPKTIFAANQDNSGVINKMTKEVLENFPTIFKDGSSNISEVLEAMIDANKNNKPAVSNIVKTLLSDIEKLHTISNDRTLQVLAFIKKKFAPDIEGAFLSSTLARSENSPLRDHGTWFIKAPEKTGGLLLITGRFRGTLQEFWHKTNTTYGSGCLYDDPFIVKECKTLLESGDIVAEVFAGKLKLRTAAEAIKQLSKQDCQVSPPRGPL